MKNTLAIVGLAAKAEVGFDDTLGLVDATFDALVNTDIDVISTKLVMSDYDSAKQAAEILSDEDISQILVCVGTWSEDNYVLQFLKGTNKPIIFHAFPHMESGSLCGTMQITSVMNDIGFTNFKTVYAAPASEEAVSKILNAYAELESKTVCTKKDETFYIGSIGGHASGMTEIAFDEFALYEKCGAIVSIIDETELLEAVDAVSDDDVKAALTLIQKRNFRIEVSDTVLEESLKYYLGMKAIINKYGLSGLAVKCYTRYMGKICLGYSLLSDEGYVCSCEGDVNSAVMMKIMKDITGECVNNTDILNPLPDDNVIIFAHCGSSGFSIAPEDEAVELCPVRIMETGVCSKFRPKLGTVTAADLVGHGNQLRMSVMVGEAIEKEYLFPGNQACIKFERNVEDICNDVLAKACGHHWMVGYGDISKELEEYCQAHGIIFRNIT